MHTLAPLCHSNHHSAIRPAILYDLQRCWFITSGYSEQGIVSPILKGAIDHCIEPYLRTVNHTTDNLKIIWIVEVQIARRPWPYLKGVVFLRVLLGFLHGRP